MNRLGIFVEGYTESVFVEGLIREIAGRRDILIDQARIKGGMKRQRDFWVKKESETVKGEPASTARFYVLIVNCGGDDQVKTRIVEEHKNLHDKGYWRLLGIRDVRPKYKREEITRLETGLRSNIDDTLIPVDFILAVMEIEAWFLAESTHFPRIDPSITISAIKESLGLDVENDDLQARDEPEADLKRCYAIGGKVYDKKDSRQTIQALDFGGLRLLLVKRFKHLDRLVSAVEDFFKLESA